MNYILYYAAYGLIVAIVAIIIIISIVIAISYTVNKILLPYKYKTTNLSVSEMYSALQLVIQNEIDLYEKSVFENGGKMLNNQTFENYYKDICTRIVDDISEEFLDRFSYYLDRESIIRFISRTVKAYLQEKIL